MKYRMAWLPLLAAALATPGQVRAQQDECPCERPGMIGVSFTVRTTQSDRESEPKREVLIGEVRPGSPAEAAGVSPGDVVVRVNGRPAVDGFRELDLREGDTVQLRIRRGADERDLTIVAAPRPAARFGVVRPGPGERPMVFMGGDTMQIPLQAITMRIDSLQTRLVELIGRDSGLVRLRMDSVMNILSDSAEVFIQRMPSVQFRVHEGTPLREGVIVDAGVPVEGRPFFMELGRRAAAGAELAEMNEGLRRYFQNVQRGALVIDVSPNTPAARAGLEPGDVIVRAAGSEVNHPEDVRRALMRGEDGRVALEVVRQGRRRELSLEWDGRERLMGREMVPTRVRGREPRALEPTRAPGPTRTPRN